MSSIRINEYKIGSDPEVFLINKETKDIVSAIPFVPGSKYEPYQIPDLSEGHMIQTDNIMVEYCLPPADNFKDLRKSFQDCIDYTHKIIPAELQVSVRASGRVQSRYLLDDQAKKFGWKTAHYLIDVR